MTDGRTRAPGDARAVRLAAAGLTAALVAACGSDPRPKTPEPASEPVWFEEVSDAWGVVFDHSSAAGGGYSTAEITGSGGALLDYDGDGDLDLYLVDAGSEGGTARNRLYRQDAGPRFVEIARGAGADDAGFGMGALAGDVDNDGDLDLAVTNLGPDVLYLNQGDGSFREAGVEAGLGVDRWSTSACFLDYDRDGALDLYVATYLVFEPGKRCTDRAGNPEFCGPDSFRGVQDLLYRGAGDGHFTDVSATALPGRPANKGLGVLCEDLDGDGWTDVYVANDGEENQLWINRGDGRFDERALLMGAALNLFGKPEASMGVAAGDLDGDLDLDLFMTHLDRETNTFYANLGEAGFEDRTPATGLGPASMPYTGFGTAFFDADLDGDLDLASVNGRVRRGASLADRAERARLWERDPSLPASLEPYAEPDLFFLNQGAGVFRDASREAGWSDRPVAVSRSLLVGDLDADGDQDLVVTHCGGRTRVFRNRMPGAGRWLAVEAMDLALGRDALGATSTLRVGEARLLRTLTGSYGYLASTAPRAHFGLGQSGRPESLAIRWPDGRRTVFVEPPTDRSLRVLRPRREGTT